MSDNFDQRIKDTEKGAMGRELLERARLWRERTKKDK